MAMDLSRHGGEIPVPMTSTYVAHSHPYPHHKNNPEEEEEEEEAEEEEESSEEDGKKQLVLLGASNASSSTRAVRYRECLKNHAASMGGTATDGCGEFMPSGEEGSIEALKCSACSCHRNFHRKEVEGDPPAASVFHHHLQELYHYNNHGRQQQARPPAAAMIMPLGAIHSTSAAESDEIGMMRGAPNSHPPPPPPPPSYGYNYHSGSSAGKKRFRTKFTQEQKEKMLGFAERVGWRLQRQEEGSVQQFCQEIGVKRRVLKVWMHNNKHHLSSKKLTPSPNCHINIAPLAAD